MLNFDFKRPSRKCSVEDRSLLPGEKFYSALVETETGLERSDLCENAWDGPPEGCIAWWTSTIPELSKGRVYWAPTDVLLAYFEHLQQQSLEPDTTYITALVLVQKKILQLVETLDDKEPPLMVLKHLKTKTIFEIPVVQVSDDRIREIQCELGERLFTDQAPISESDNEADD